MNSNNPIWIAIDGGGTKTHISACDDEQRILFDKAFDSTNYKAYSKDEVCKVMTGVWRELFDAVGVDTASVRGAVIAVSGCDSPQDEAFYRKLMLELGMPSQRMFVCNDTEGIYRGMTLRRGVCLVGGTGSIACAYDEEKQIARVGGWGAPLSDIGSGYWIGFQILQAFLMKQDGLNIPDDFVFSVLQDMFSRRKEPPELIINTLSVAQIASVAATACDMAYGGYPGKRVDLCSHTVAASQEHLADHVSAVYHRCTLGDDFPIVMVGGLMNNAGYYQDLKEKIRQKLPMCRIEFLRPDKPPAIHMLRFCQRKFAD